MPYQARLLDPEVERGLRRIGRSLRLARQSRGLSQLSLEERSNLDQTTISRIENGLAPSVRLERYASLIAALELFD